MWESIGKERVRVGETLETGGGGGWGFMMERAAREVLRRETNEVKMGQRANYL